MTITFNGWMIIASWVLILAVLIGLMIVEEREDKRKAQKSAERKKRLERMSYERDYNDWKDLRSEYNPVKCWKKEQHKDAV